MRPSGDHAAGDPGSAAESPSRVQTRNVGAAESADQNSSATRPRELPRRSPAFGATRAEVRSSLDQRQAE